MSVAEHPTRRQRRAAAHSKWLAMRRAHQAAEHAMWAGALLLTFSESDVAFLREAGFLSERDEAIFRRRTP